jgi:flagellar biosynthesis/type III secretory pathway protein FliH
LPFQKEVRNLSNVSTPFKLNDLSKTDSSSSKAPFVAFFNRGSKSSGAIDNSGTDDGSPVEDQSRKVFEDAYTQGEKAGYEMGMRRVDSLAKRLEKQIEEVKAFKEELRTRYENLATELALIFAEAIVLRECTDKREILMSMVRKAMDSCDDKGEIIIRVRTEDAQYIESLASSQLRILKDDSLKEPGFVIETNLGDIDGRISTQFEEIRNTIAGIHGR